MFQKIVLAYSGSPESRRALTSAIQLAKTFGAELHAVIAIEELPDTPFKNQGKGEDCQCK
jgi:nucleotide-binding universal stress UspA family protein